jgi:hypothetical protein
VSIYRLCVSAELQKLDREIGNQEIVALRTFTNDNATEKMMTLAFHLVARP